MSVKEGTEWREGVNARKPPPRALTFALNYTS